VGCLDGRGELKLKREASTCGAHSSQPQLPTTHPHPPADTTLGDAPSIRSLTRCRSPGSDGVKLRGLLGNAWSSHLGGVESGPGGRR